MYSLLILLILYRSWCSTCCEHISVTTSVLKDRFSKYDRGGTGDISFDDFLSLMQVSIVSYRNFSYTYTNYIHELMYCSLALSVHQDLLHDDGQFFKAHFASYSGDSKIITCAEFIRFLEAEQVIKLEEHIF